MITLRNTEATSPRGTRYLVTTETKIWESAQFTTTVQPITESPVEWDPYMVPHSSSDLALKGHNQVVQQIKSGQLDGLLNVRSK